MQETDKRAITFLHTKRGAFVKHLMGAGTNHSTILLLKLILWLFLFSSVLSIFISVSLTYKT